MRLLTACLKRVLRSVLLAADLAVIPVLPSPRDIWSCADVLKLCSEAATFHSGLRTRLVRNRRLPRTALSRDVREALARFEVPVCTTIKFLPIKRQVPTEPGHPVLRCQCRKLLSPMGSKAW